MRISEQLPLNSYSILDDKEYTHYRANKKIKIINRIKGRTEYKKFIRTYLRVISEELLEREGGVCIKNFGYWFNWLSPTKTTGRIITRNGLVETYSFITDHRLYFPTFWGTNNLVWWSMDKTFNETWRDKLAEKIKKGKKYKMYLSSFKQMKYF